MQQGVIVLESQVSHFCRSWRYIHWWGPGMNYQIAMYHKGEIQLHHSAGYCFVIETV